MQNATLETSDPEIKVDRLMHEIRERVAREQRNVAESHYLAADTQSINYDVASAALADLSAFRLQPEFRPSTENRYHVNDLLKYHGENFVRNAYRALLMREPEAEALAGHLENLSSGRFNKIDVLASIHFSPEGRQAGVKIDGLALPVAIRRLGRIPLFGYLIQMGLAVARLPRLHQHQRQSESYLLAQQQRIVDHFNQLHTQLADELAQISAQIAALAEQTASQQQANELLTQQQQVLAQRQDEARKQLAEDMSQVSAQAAALAEQAADEQRAIEQLLQQHQVLAEGQLELSGVIEKGLSAARQSVEEQTQEAIIRHDQLTKRLDEQTQQFLAGQQQMSQELWQQIQQLIDYQHQTRTELLLQERRLTLLLETAHQQDSVHPALSKVMATEEEHLLDPLYAAFEDRFRGPREEVKGRLQVYLPILKDAEVTAAVLDVGCGRGEWLELLRNEAIEARGVDHNRVFVEQCRQNRLDVVEADALVYLRDLPDNSLHVITSFHLAEHLSFEILIKLLDEMIRTLRSGGLLILETPNPENFMVGSFSFYADPTHRNPIPSATLQFLLESRGLSRVEVMKLRPWDAARIEGDSEIVTRFNEYFYSAPDYGIIGRKI